MAKAKRFTQKNYEQAVAQLSAQRELLLGLIRPLSNTMRNWKPNDSQQNIHEILFHIGWNECHLVSHLGKKVSAPSEVTLMRYLHQSRESVLERLNQLTEAERNQSFADGWTAPQVLDQILAHEQKHIAHIEAILSQWRLHLTARLAAERSELFAALLGLSEAQLTTAEVQPGWTIKDLLAHVAFWDGFHTNRMQLVLDGRIHEIMEIGDDADMDDFNARLLAENKKTPLEQAIAMLQKERGGFLQLLKRLDDRTLQSQIRLPWGWRTHMRVWARWRYQHDAEHAQQIQVWRDAQPREAKRQIGPKAVLRGLLRTCRQEFVSLLPLLLEDEWNSRPVCGVWTMKDLVGHITAWAEVGGVALAQALAGETPHLPPITNFEQWNLDEAAKRADLPWDDIWKAYEASYQALLSGLAALPDEALAVEFTAPWGPTYNLSRWLTIWPLHEREHAVDVRHALDLSRWPKRLTEHPQK
ncbi:MAG: DinB family protein [Ardenticatenaceae bacterium]|nr:DinB family protein [Anaerolineales bacterium]MCB8940886.1 DinB family protein [Ardenticatenaceae bacterium]MCB8972225.1 DinB family protein [Ardenticatenaceae bacterium]